MPNLRLVDVVRDLASFEDDADIFAREPWTEASEAVLARDEAACTRAVQDGFMGFMQVSMAREFLEGWFQNVPERPSLAEQCATLIHYAVFDA